MQFVVVWHTLETVVLLGISTAFSREICFARSLATISPIPPAFRVVEFCAAKRGATETISCTEILVALSYQTSCAPATVGALLCKYPEVSRWFVVSGFSKLTDHHSLLVIGNILSVVLKKNVTMHMESVLTPQYCLPQAMRHVGRMKQKHMQMGAASKIYITLYRSA